LIEDGPRCRAADIPEVVQFATKPMLGKRMLERDFQAGGPCDWVAGMRVMAVTISCAAGRMSVTSL